MHYGANFWARKTTCVHARYAGQIFGPGKPPPFTQDTRIHKQFILGDRKWTAIRATTFPQFIEQFCSLIKMRLRITANFTSLMKESGWVPKALLNFQQIVGVEEYFFIMLSQQKNLHSVIFYWLFLWGYSGNRVQMRSLNQAHSAIRHSTGPVPGQ